MRHKLVGNGGKAIPLGPQLHEDVLNHCIGADRNAPIWTSFRLGPKDVGRECREHSRDIALGERRD